MVKNRTYILPYFIALFLLLSTVSLTSCKKYDEGPALSLRSKKERVSNSWKAATVLENGEDKTSDYSDFRVTFTEDGNVTWIPSGTFSPTATGTWSFSNDKNDILVVMEAILGQTTRTLRIIRLKEEELWFSEGTREYRLVPL